MDIDADPAKGIKGLYRNNRSDQIVTDQELGLVLKDVPARQRSLIIFAAETGLRRGDIVALKWDHLQEHHFIFETGKSRGRKRVIVPITNVVREMLIELQDARSATSSNGRVPSSFIFTTDAGTPFQENSVTQAWGRACKPHGITKHFNDLRGTAITRFAQLGWTNEQIADVVGWEVERVSNIRKHYVDAASISLQLAATLEKTRMAS